MADKNNQVTLSYELLHLMQWLIDNEPERIKHLITYALDHGLKEELRKEMDTNLAASEDLHESIIDFLHTFEMLLNESMNELAMKKMVEKNLMPAIDHIDNKACDTSTVQFSVEKATSKLERNPQENAQDILFKEILRCWKPNKKTATH